MVTMWQFKRALRHWLITHRALKRRFSEEVLNQIEQRIKALEQSHSGEIEVMIEAHLPWFAALTGVTARQRALQLFAAGHVWDTEHNNGVLVYVLLADQAVEIVADRGFNARVSAAQWQQICDRMNVEFKANRWLAGLLSGLNAIGDLMTEHFSLEGERSNELPDRPILL
jgi:uncharacterized membrane protein